MGDATFEQAKKHSAHLRLSSRDSSTQRESPPAFQSVIQRASIPQLQRTHGNRFVLQMVRASTPRPDIKSSAGRGKKIIQLDRLVEFPTGKDVQDFAMTRRQVEGSLKTPSSGNWFTRDAFRLAPGETLYLWGHMDEEKIGSLSFQEVAAHMVKNGFRGCAAIRLIGCNNPIIPQVAPKRLHLALAYYLANPAEAGADNSDSDSDTDEDVAAPDGDEIDEDLENEEEGGDPSIGHWADPATAMASPSAAAAAAPKPTASPASGGSAAAASAGASASVAPPLPTPAPPTPMGASSSSSSSSSSAAPAHAVMPMARAGMGAAASAASAAPVIKAPVVFATIGPLFSSGNKGFTEGWRVAVSTPKEESRRREQRELMDNLKEIPPMQRAEPPMLSASDIEGLISYYSLQAGLDLKHPTEEILEKLEKYFEKEIQQLQRKVAEGTDVYPTLKRAAPTATDPHNTEWNPAAWVSFP